ncbi:hypothetical protein AHAS_Ahas10G0156700 [Arachis hypogaea]
MTQLKIVNGMSVYNEYEIVFCPISHKDFVHDKEKADILRSAFASAKLALSKHQTKHSESIHTSECPNGLNALRSPPHVVPKGCPSFKRLEADID